MFDPTAKTQVLKGRGSTQRVAHRFEQLMREVADSDWPEEPDVDAGSSLPPTQVILQEVRSAISRNDSPDIHFEQGLNPYRGCEHGCAYCYARPTHSYLGLSPGLDFETRIVAKSNLVDVLRRELMAPHYRASPIVLGSATDAYQPAERRLRITRRVLELLSACHHPVAVITKGSGLTRDIGLLSSMAERGLVCAYVTITTLDGPLARALEPRAASPARRLQLIRDLAGAGVPVGVSVAPQIPFVNDDMESVLAAAAQAGARSAFYSVIRLPWEVNTVFQQWLAQHVPMRAERVMARIREMRGGRDYDSDFKTRMKGQGIWANLLHQRFEAACRRHGLGRALGNLDLSLFRPDLLGPQRVLF